MFIPEEYKEVTLGVYAKEPVQSDTPKILDSYRARASSILKADHNHYDKHRHTIKQAIRRGGIDPEGMMCYAFAGGHPKLEGVAGFQHVEVIDATGDMYADLHAEYVDGYSDIGVPKITDYTQGLITSEMIEGYALNDVAAFTFCHFLEHLPHDAAKGFLKACYSQPIIIYGPNIERAVDKNWFHFRPKDHNTFWTSDALCDYLDALGYNTVVEKIDEDYLIVAKHWID